MKGQVELDLIFDLTINSGHIFFLDKNIVPFFAFVWFVLCRVVLFFFCLRLVYFIILLSIYLFM